MGGGANCPPIRKAVDPGAFAAFVGFLCRNTPGHGDSDHHHGMALAGFSVPHFGQITVSVLRFSFWLLIWRLCRPIGDYPDSACTSPGCAVRNPYHLHRRVGIADLLPKVSTSAAPLSPPPRWRVGHSPSTAVRWTGCWMRCGQRCALHRGVTAARRKGVPYWSGPMIAGAWKLSSGGWTVGSWRLAV